MIRQVNSPSLVLLPPISVKVTAKAFIFRDVARRLMTVRRTSPGQARRVRVILT